MEKLKIEDSIKGIQKNIPLAPYTTFKIGGPAKYFYVAKTEEDLIGVIKLAKKLKLPFFVLGGGSNLLVSDKGYEGLVINFQFSIFNFQKNKIVAGAGLPLGKLVNISMGKELTGLEWAAGIPGTVGGAIVGNAGAFGKSMGNIVKEVEALDFKTLKRKKLKNKDCKFGYRDSIFKRKRNLIILSAIFQLRKGNKNEIQKKMKEYLNCRKSKQPLNFPSAGSIFKNPSGFSAGELIEKCGLKGKKIGNVKISEKHANFFINLGNGGNLPAARAKDVIKLIKLIKKKVKNKFKIDLEEEIQLLGF